MKKIYIIIIIILLVGVGVWAWMSFQNKSSLPSNQVPEPSILISQVDYLCDSGKTINAKYYQGPEAPQPKPGEPPTPRGSVGLVLSDGRQLTLSQTVSGSGIRYATASETFIFWSKGNGAFITENDIQTYSGCIAIAPDPGGLPQVYANATSGFSVRYPENYTADYSYQYQDLGPGKEINGIKFTIPIEMATGTNLSSYDTGVSVETIPNIVENCVAGLFLYRTNNGTSTEIIDNNIQYSVASSSGAAAGNYYEEIVWALPIMNSCIGVRYLIHSTNIDNYPKGAVKEFDRQALINQFDAIRRSLVLSP